MLFVPKYIAAFFIAEYHQRITFFICFILLFFSASLSAQTDSSSVVFRDTARERSIAVIRETFQNNIPKPVGWTNDLELIFTDAETKELDSLIAAFEKKTTIEICIITLDSVLVSEADFDETIRRIGNTWGVGKKDINNGIIIGMCTGYRRIRIQNANGITKMITDEETREILDKYFFPPMTRFEYFDGMKSGLLQLMALLESRMK